MVKGSNLLFSIDIQRWPNCIFRPFIWDYGFAMSVLNTFVVKKKIIIIMFNIKKETKYFMWEEVWTNLTLLRLKHNTPRGWSFNFNCKVLQCSWSTSKNTFWFVPMQIRWASHTSSLSEELWYEKPKLLIISQVMWVNYIGTYENTT